MVQEEYMNNLPNVLPSWLKYLKCEKISEANSITIAHDWCKNHRLPRRIPLL